jgi:hypothetical protein
MKEQQPYEDRIIANIRNEALRDQREEPHFKNSFGIGSQSYEGGVNCK